MFPEFNRRVVEAEKHIAVLDQIGDRLAIFDAVSFDEKIERGLGGSLGFGLPDVVQVALDSDNVTVDSH